MIGMSTRTAIATRFLFVLMFLVRKFEYDFVVLLTEILFSVRSIITASNLCLLLQKEQNVKGGEGPSGKQAVGINNGTR